MNKLFIHIGTYKTGSTAIQEWLGINSDYLKKNDILYIPKSENFLRRTMDRGDANCNYVELKNVRQILLKAAKKKNNKTIVISSEHLSGGPRFGYIDSLTIAKTMKDITDSLNLQVFIIVYLRRQDNFFESLYTELIHSGEAYDFKFFLKEYGSNEFNWYNLLNNYARIFGKENMIVRSYDKLYLKDSESIYKDFGDIIGIPPDIMNKFKTPEKINIGYSRDALETARICNKFYSEKDKKIVRIILQSSNSKNIFENYPYFTQEERKQFISKYCESNDKVLNEYFVNHKGKLFSELENVADIYEGFNLEKLTKVIMNIEINNYRQNQLNSRLLRFIINSEGHLKNIFKKIFRHKLKF